MGAIPIILQRRRLSQRGTITAAGTVDVPIETVPAGRIWQVERIRVKSSSALRTQFGLYIGRVTLGEELDWTPNGNDDVADEHAGPWAESSALLIGSWSGGTPGALVSVTIQVAEADAFGPIESIGL